MTALLQLLHTPVDTHVFVFDRSHFTSLHGHQSVLETLPLDYCYV